MIRVLYFVDRLRRGGIQSLLLNMLRENGGRVDFDVLTLDDGNHYELEDEIKALGVTVHRLNKVWLNSVDDIPGYLRALKYFFRKNHDYDAIHLNSSSKNAAIVYFARKYGIKTRIAHAHNSGFQTENTLKIAVGNMLKAILYLASTHHIACSSEAGKWLFGNRQFTVIPNGINALSFSYSEQMRKDLRNEMLVADDTLIIGCIGRFVRQKNHRFLIPIMQQLKQLGSTAKLLLIGAGELESELRNLFTASNIDDRVIFAGFRSDCNRWYSAIDILVMPSLYEGMPVTMLEAQASGLPVIASDTISREAAVSSLVTFLPITGNGNAWSDAILATKPNPQRDACNFIAGTDFDIHSMLERLIKIYGENA